MTLREGVERKGENAREGGIEREEPRREGGKRRGPSSTASSGGRSDWVRGQNFILIPLVRFLGSVFSRASYFRHEHKQTQPPPPLPKPNPSIISPIEIGSLSLSVFTPHLPLFPAVNMSPFPSLSRAPVSNHNHIKVQPLAGCVFECVCQKERERTLCCG